ncbi:hypothetical protein K439DRAFT_1624238 [Ramaria rubella]|nr:hypothetical protein K439DRAFT_1624238 [Ramaria rubella]
MSGKGKGKEWALDSGWMGGWLEKMGLMEEIRRLQKMIHNLANWLRYNIEGVASLNDSLKTLHAILEIDFKFLKKWWEMFAHQLEVEVEAKMEDVVKEKTTEKELEKESGKSKVT